MRSKIETDVQMGELIYKHLRGELSADEQEILNSWASNDKNGAFFRELESSDRLYEGMIQQQYVDTDAQFRKLQYKIAKKRRFRWGRWISGVAALLIIGVGISLFTQQKQPEVMLPLNLLSGKDYSILQTADGEVVYIADSVKKMQPVPEEKTEPVAAITVTPVPVKYNTLATSSHGKIEMMLSDSSRVWLNAGSELRYPDVFGKQQRLVYLKGEAYFEVSKNPGRPFIVNIGKTKIEVLGTQFNVKTLGSDACRTTLVEGAVRVKSDEQAAVQLIPGQEAEVSATGKIEVRKVDVRYQTAWKRNQFAFHEQSLYRILKELSEWYDFTFEFENIETANFTYTAIMPRSANVADVLRLLQKTGDFTYIEGENGHIIIREK